MSYDIFVCRFANGETAPLDLDTVRGVLGPHAVGGAGDDDVLRLDMGEGGTADVYLGGPDSITFNRFGGEGIMDLLADLLRRVDGALILPGGTVVLRREEDREQVPAALRDVCTVVVARTGAEITEAIRAS